MNTCRRPFFAPYNANIEARNGRFAPFCHFCSHFLDIECYGEEGKIHGDLVLAEMPESLVLHVVLDLTEDRLWFYGAFRPVPKSSLRGQPLPCPAPILHQAVVDLNLPFSLGPPVAPPAEWASLANSWAVMPKGIDRSIHVQFISWSSTCRTSPKSKSRYIQYKMAPPNIKGSTIFPVCVVSRCRSIKRISSCLRPQKYKELSKTTNE